MAISEKYAGPQGRWAMLKRDHPLACHKEVIGDHVAAEVPEEFAKGANLSPDFVICTIHQSEDGPVLGKGAKQIPAKVYINSKWVDFTRDSEGWEKVGTMALGRALKDAGYPGDDDSLRRLLAWRKAEAEREAILAGRRPAPPLPVPRDEAEHAPEQPEPAAPAATPGIEGPWNDEAASALKPLTDRFTADQKAELDEYAQTRGGHYWTLTGGSLRTVSARARSMAPKGAEHQEQPAAQPKAAAKASPRDREPFPDAASIEDVHRLIADVDGLDLAQQDHVFEAIGPLADKKWDMGGLTVEEYRVIRSAVDTVRNGEKVGVLL